MKYFFFASMIAVIIVVLVAAIEIIKESRQRRSDIFGRLFIHWAICAVVVTIIIYVAVTVLSPLGEIT